MSSTKYSIRPEITMQGLTIRCTTDTFPWQSVLRLATERPRPIHILTYNLPALLWFAEQFPRLSMQHVHILADSEFRAKAEQLGRAYSHLRIATHPKLHSKVALVEPDRVYVSSANLGSMGQHETTLEVQSRLLHDWYRETVWEPLWREAQEVSGHDA